MKTRLPLGRESLTTRPVHTLVGIIRMPASDVSPLRSILRRVAGAVFALLAAASLVYVDRHGYEHNADTELSFMDCVYYATVSLSTTGYGDITPLSDTARLANILVITPLRVLFFIVLIGTTVEVLTEHSRQALKIQRWRRRVRNHTVVVGYGTKGRSAVNSLLGDGMDPQDIVVVDTDQASLELASSLGLVVVHGNATSSDVLRLAGISRARSVIVGANRDSEAVLIVLTAREHNKAAHIVAGVRETENVHLLRQSGADTVVVSSETAGRLLGMATRSPKVVDLVEDLLTPDAGLAIAERTVEHSEVGGSPRHLADIVLGVVRDDELYRVDAPEVDAIEHGDTLLYVRRVTPPNKIGAEES